MPSYLPWNARILELIDDGPVEVNWLIGEVYGLVPPGRAWRMREYLRMYQAKRKGLAVRPSDLPTDEAIRSGQRAVVREAIGKLVYAKQARYLVDSGVKYLEKNNAR
jgi:hypothetical protein